MKVESYYDEIGVNPGASVEEIRRAYRRLALHYHPDHNTGNRVAQERFVAIAKAYRILLDYSQTEPERRPNQCSVCSQLKRLYPGTDGRACCADCLLGSRGHRLLPHPFVRLVRFFGVIGLWLAAVALIIYGARTGDNASLTAALVCVVAGMIWLAVATIWISYTADPHLPISTQPHTQSRRKRRGLRPGTRRARALHHR